MPYPVLELRPADENDHDVIVGLIESAARWLRRTKDTDQWAHPWRSEEDRSNRIRRDLTAGKTWLLRDRSLAVATITADTQDYPIWPVERQPEPAVYVSRLVVSVVMPAGGSVPRCLTGPAGPRAWTTAPSGSG